MNTDIDLTHYAFVKEAKELKNKVHEIFANKNSELFSKSPNLAVQTIAQCILSGSSISSIYHGEEVNDYDLWCRDDEGLKIIEAELDKFKDEVSTIDPKYGQAFVDGKIVTPNAVTLQNKFQYIKLATYENCRKTFDYVHCLPYMDLKTNQLYISFEQWKSIKLKKLKANRAFILTDALLRRQEKFKQRGWV